MFYINADLPTQYVNNIIRRNKNNYFFNKYSYELAHTFMEGFPFNIIH